MKIEVEIAEEELKATAERKVKEAVTGQINTWMSEKYIRDKVSECWKSSVDSLVREELNNSKPLRAKIAAEIERRLRAQLAAMIKNVQG